jgi:hypothetical protein
MANPVFHACTKHIEINFHFMRERVASRDLDVKFIATSDQLDDMFTKPDTRQMLEQLKSNLNVVHSTSSYLRGVLESVTYTCCIQVVL